MAIKKIFSGTEIRVPGIWGGLLPAQKASRDLKRVLCKLGIKSADPGFRITLKISGQNTPVAKGVTYNVPETTWNIDDNGSID